MDLVVKQFLYHMLIEDIIYPWDASNLLKNYFETSYTQQLMYNICSHVTESNGLHKCTMFVFPHLDETKSLEDLFNAY